MSALMIKADAMELRGRDGELTGQAMARGHFGPDGVSWVAPRRDSLAEAEADVEKIHRVGVTRFRVALPSRGFTVFAADADDASLIAFQRWGAWPYEVTA